MTPPDGGTLHLVVAGPLDQRTGGYLYDARMVAGLRARGRSVEVLEVAGRWPQADEAGRADLRARLAALPDGAVVVVDGLVGGAVPDLLDPEAARLRLLALVHHPLCDEHQGDRTESEQAAEVARLESLEARTLAAAQGVIVTSAFTRDRVLDMGAVEARVVVVEPGTERPAPDPKGTPPRPGTAAPTVLCVGSVVPRKGQLDLVKALAPLRDLEWSCDIVGSLERDHVYADAVRAAIEPHGLGDRISLVGEVDDAALQRYWSGTDLFVLPSHYEGYGMAFTEALVRGLPIVGTTGGAIPTTVPPEVGRLVEPADVDTLSSVLREVLGDSDVRADLGHRSTEYAASLPTWDAQVTAFAAAIDRVAGTRDAGDTFSSDWLALREPADHAARARALVERVAGVGAERGWGRVLDLGSGRGSNLRWLGPQLAWATEWVALDHDTGLLAELQESWAGPGTLRTVEGDLAAEGISEIASADLVTASALLDLVTGEWVEALAAACADRGVAALLALSWDGSAALEPTDAVAEEILAAVRAHQQGEKGMGVALGPAAPEATADAFRRAGMEVITAETPWRLAGADDGPLMHALVSGWVDAACEIDPDRTRAFRDWLDDRRPALRAGEVTIAVGHVDLLALPAVS